MFVFYEQEKWLGNILEKREGIWSEYAKKKKKIEREDEAISLC